MIARSLAAALVGTTLMACAGGPPAQVEVALDVEVPPQYGEGAIHDSTLVAVGLTWWHDFDEPGLDELVAEAVTRNHDLQAAARRVEQSMSLARIAGAELYPSLGLNAGGARAKQNFVGLPVPGGDVLSSTTNSFNLGLVLSWELDLWGRIRSGRSAALADLQATFADYYGVRLSVSSQTVRAWMDLITARLLVELAEDTVDNFTATAEQVRARYERGLRSSLDLRFALGNLASAHAAMASLQRTEGVAARRLELLLGRYPDGNLQLARDLPDTPETAPAELPTELLSRRPDLAAVERRVAAAGMRVAEAKAALYPRISLSATGGTASNELKDLVSTDFFVWSLAANLFQPLFQGGRLRESVRLNEARAREAAEQYAQIVLTAYAEVENAITADAFLAEELRYTEDGVLQSRAAESTATLQYQAGIIDFITLQESQRSRIQSEVDLIAVRAERLAARIDLYVALGGGFTFDPTSTETASAREPADPVAHPHAGS